MYRIWILCVLALVAGCAQAGPPPVPTQGTTKNVLVIINDNSPASREIGAYYASKRHVPAGNVCRIKCSTTESVDIKEYREKIEDPVKAYIAQKKLAVDYLVLTKGIPIKTGGSRSVDGLLMCMDMGFGFDFEGKRGIPNPYYKSQKHFSYKEYGFYLATRLDGYTTADVKALVDRSLAAKPAKGLFFLDMASNRTKGAYGEMNFSMAVARDLIKNRGYTAEVDPGMTFVGGKEGLMGYFSWGSNDSSFDRDKYKSNRFLPGAIAETAVSTSARTFSQVNSGQSVITDLIEAGVTGVKGYVAEPYLTAIADPVVLFDRYVCGYNLAESFYAASKFIYWRDLVVGDPLCNPYAKKRP
ncbi:MAG: TIGR03790 family protein [Armatimonadota bacterium]